MKIKSIDKEKRKENLKKILPIVTSGLALGISAFLVHKGVLQYNNIVDLGNGNLDKIIGMAPFLKNIDTKAVMDALSSQAGKLGSNAYVLLPKAFTFGLNIAKPIIESDKVQNSKIVKKIKGINKNIENDPMLIINPKLLDNEHPRPIAKGLALGTKAFLMANSIIDYNNIFDFSNLPHKFAAIAEMASKIDLNKIVLGAGGVGVIKDIIRKVQERRDSRDTAEVVKDFIEDKEEENDKIETKAKEPRSLKSKVTFKGIVKKIFNEKGLPSLFTLSETEKQFLTRTKVEMIGNKQNMQSAER